MTDVMIGLAVTLAVGFAAGVAVGWQWGRTAERRRWRGTDWPVLIHRGNGGKSRTLCTRLPMGTYDLRLRRRFVQSEPSP